MISADICVSLRGVDTFVTCLVFMHCFGSFLLQVNCMLVSLQKFVFKGQNMKVTVNRRCCLLAFYVVTSGPAVIRTVCKYITNITFVLIRFSSETPCLYSEIAIRLSMFLAAI